MNCTALHRTAVGLITIVSEYLDIMAGKLGAIILSLLAGSTMSMFSTSTSSVACIDDSDCTSLGHKYACYFYQCINYMDKETSMEHCDTEDQCRDTMQCYRYIYTKNIYLDRYILPA